MSLPILKEIAIRLAFDADIMQATAEYTEWLQALRPSEQQQAMARRILEGFVQWCVEIHNEGTDESDRIFNPWTESWADAACQGSIAWNHESQQSMGTTQNKFSIEQFCGDEFGDQAFDVELVQRVAVWFEKWGFRIRQCYYAEPPVDSGSMMYEVLASVRPENPKYVAPTLHQRYAITSVHTCVAFPAEGAVVRYCDEDDDEDANNTQENGEVTAEDGGDDEDNIYYDDDDDDEVEAPEIYADVMDDGDDGDADE